jgi:hypothetical protein
MEQVHYPEDESKGPYRRSWITGIMAFFMSANDSSMRVITGTLSLLISSSSGSGVTNTLPIESCANQRGDPQPHPAVAGRGEFDGRHATQSLDVSVRPTPRAPDS